MTVFAYIFFSLAIVLSIIFRFPQFKMFKYVFSKNETKSGGTSSYQTLLVSLGANIGTGNLVGVTTGIVIGGPGVILWMVIYAFFSMIFSYLENTLSQLYKEQIEGEFRGGACYYIRKGLNSPFLALIFAFYLLITNTILFPPVQTNTISETGRIVYNISPQITGIILIVAVFMLLFNGTKLIIKTAEKIVPLMSITYVSIIILVILFNINKIPGVFSLIVSEGLTLKAFNASLLTQIMIVGIRRSMFSNEAGLGTIPSISAMADSKKPIDQGYYQMFGVFIDTILLCTLMGIFILIYTPNLSDYSGSDLIINVFEKTFGTFGSFLASFFLFTFAFASLCGQYYLGESNAIYLSKNYKINKKVMIVIYRFLFILGIIIGITRTTLESFVLIDIGMVILGSINIIVIIYLAKINKKHLKN